MARALRIGNCSGFYGDRFAAMREMLADGELDVLTRRLPGRADNAAALANSASKDPTRGYATTFVRQLEDCLGVAWERGVKIVTNAGGLNPAGCAAAVREVAGRARAAGQRWRTSRATTCCPAATSWRRRARAPRLDHHRQRLSRRLGHRRRPRCGGAGRRDRPGDRRRARRSGRPRGGTAGPATTRTPLAGALVAGHVLECGAQATGGNYSFFTEVPGIEHVGFPLAEIESDGTAISPNTRAPVAWSISAR